MTTPTQSVSVRRTLYNNQFMLLGAVEPVYYDDQYDSQQNVDVLDPVLAYDPFFFVNGYIWNGIRQQLNTYRLSFDGVNDNITIPHAASINNLPSGNFTVDFVAKDISMSGYGEIFTKTNDSFVGLDIYFSSFDDLKLVVNISYNGGVGWNYFECILNAINVNNTHHYELVWTAATKTLKVFVDGINQAITSSTNADTTRDSDAAYNLAVGSTSFTPYDSFLGMGLNYLTASNIARHTSNFTPPSLTVCPLADANTVLRLALDEGSGTIAHDTSGNNNNGTISGATWVKD